MNLFRLSLFFACLLLILSSTKAQTNQSALPILAKQEIVLPESTEVGLEIDARSPGASWAREGAEAAALSIMVDGKYQQDVILWAGELSHNYRVLLGKLDKGKHTIAVGLNAARSAPEARRAEIKELRLLMLASQLDRDEQLAITHAPFLYARADSIDHFTDLPLLMYYEIEHGKENELLIRYTTIFTNEDGGTPTVALMARWGRTTDIEWTYEVRLRQGKILEETYQGVRHQTRNYTGERVAGAHPILAVASDNNNFSDLACSAVRFAPLPIHAHLEQASRESVMSTDPLIYKVMVEELTREKRIGQTVGGGANIITDPRQYLYLEAYGEQHGAALAFEVRQDGDAKVLRSDLGDARLRIDRSGYFQTTVSRPTQREVTITARCFSSNNASNNPEVIKEKSCQKVQLKKVFTLDENFVPHLLNFERQAEKNLAPDETVSYRLAQ